MSISDNIIRMKASLPQEVTLIAVSKFHPADAIREAYDAGQRVFGESRAQELKVKQKELPEDIEWHFIGTLQTNKVKDIAPFVDMIHSVDSIKLLNEIEKQAARFGRTIRILLEIHVAKEETKHGLSASECKKMLEQIDMQDYPHIHFAGLMCMATDTEDESVIREEFRSVSALLRELKASFFSATPSFKELSMGMSQDYPIAIEEGCTMIRIGTTLFGGR